MHFHRRGGHCLPSGTSTNKSNTHICNCCVWWYDPYIPAANYIAFLGTYWCPAWLEDTEIVGALSPHHRTMFAGTFAAPQVTPQHSFWDSKSKTSSGNGHFLISGVKKNIQAGINSKKIIFYWWGIEIDKVLGNYEAKFLSSVANAVCNNTQLFRISYGTVCLREMSLPGRGAPSATPTPRTFA